MSVNFGYRVFLVCDKLVPNGMKHGRVLSWALRLIAGGAEPRTATGPIHFEGVAFLWTATYSSLARAQAFGLEARITRLAMTLARPGTTCIDVGANYGFITHVMALRGASVISLEASTRVFEVLGASLENNKLSCELHNAFVGKVDGPPNDASWGVKKVSLDGLLRGRRGLDRLTFVKIDVDGPDLEVLEGGREILSRHRPVVCVEVSRNPSEIFALLKELGYSHFLGTDLLPVQPGRWPANIIASTCEIAIPERGAFVRQSQCGMAP